MASFSNAVGCLATAILLLGAASVFAQTYDPMAAARKPARSLLGAENAAAPNPEFGGLPDSAGAEETFYQCTACHSTEIIKQQHLTDARWDYLWDWMVKEQGMVEPDEETKELILSYLKGNFSAGP
ncbi:cytochrome C-552 [Phaeovulum sp.]|uniref:cytochrome C-552 n=1 Tax=Phaeovulum sp. TaxID=2934796 RepID=UPI0039E56DE6